MRTSRFKFLKRVKILNHSGILPPLMKIHKYFETFEDDLEAEKSSSHSSNHQKSPPPPLMILTQ